MLAAGLGPPRLDGVEFVQLANPSRAKLGLPLAIARLLVHRYETVYWSHPASAAAYGRLRDIDADVVLANELATLPVALRLGAPVVFDAHEYSPAEVGEKLWWRLLRAPYVRWQCRRYIPHVAAMTTVAPTIADEYERDTGVKAAVVLNAPARVHLEPTPVHDPVRILHHGAARRGRGLEEMIAAAELLDERFVVDFVLVEHSPGYRDELVRRGRANKRVRFPPAWPMHELALRANDYDLGLYSLPPVNFNHRFALPNKFFEFIQGRLGVAIGPSPEMARVIREYGCGTVADDFSAFALASAVNALDDAAIATFKRASHAAASELCAEKNEELVLNAVASALGRVAPDGRQGPP